MKTCCFINSLEKQLLFIAVTVLSLRQIWFVQKWWMRGYYIIKSPQYDSYTFFCLVYPLWIFGGSWIGSKDIILVYNNFWRNDFKIVIAGLIWLQYNTTFLYVQLVSNFILYMSKRKNALYSWKVVLLY